jgi:hypothetical protein
LLLALDLQKMKRTNGNQHITSDTARWHLHLDDEPTARQASTFQESWRRFWSITNLLQPFTGGKLSSQESASAHVDGDLTPFDKLVRMGQLPTWLKECSPELWEALLPLAQSELEPPDFLVEEIGPENAPDVSWGVVECAYIPGRVAILHPRFVDGFNTQAARAAGWQVFVADRTLDVKKIIFLVNGN